MNKAINLLTLPIINKLLIKHLKIYFSTLSAVERVITDRNNRLISSYARKEQKTYCSYQRANNNIIYFFFKIKKEIID